MAVKRLLRSALARLISKLPQGILTDAEFFELYQRAGWHATPVHFYMPIPDTRRLKDELWECESECVGIDLQEADQIELVHNFQRDWAGEYDVLLERLGNPPSFGPVDAEMLYCMIRQLKPRRIVEIGSGASTRVMGQAIVANRDQHGHTCHLTAIEPFPSDDLRHGFEGLSELRVQQVQEVPLDCFATLGPHDVLFIDSSHVAKIGGDVNYEFLEIIPRLSEGVVVHIHDIFLPSEYPKKWVLDRHAFWTEQYLLQAFLTFNRTFTVRWASSFMHRRHSALLSRCFRSYHAQRHWPSSFWMQRSTAESPRVI